jgi:hypothetical protein
MKMTTKKFKVPDGLTEKEILNVIEEIVHRVASRFRFGYHDVCDLEQEARLIALDGISRWDGKRSLKNFLWTHVHNRLFNFKRDKFQRIDKPCLKCPINEFNKKTKKCKKFNEDYLEDCKFYYEWILRNLTKRNLMDTVDFDSIDDRNEHTMWSNDSEILDNLHYGELMEKIKSKIPFLYLEQYNKFISGAKLNSVTKAKIKDLIIKILEEEGITANG